MTPWVRRLLPLVRAHRRVVGLALGAALLTQLLSIAVPRTLMGAIDSALVSRDRPLGPYVAVIALLAVALVAAGFTFRFNLERAAALLEYDLRTSLHGALIRQSFSFHDQVHSGELVSRANSDVRVVGRFLTFAPSIAVTFIGFVAALVLMCAVSVPLTLVAIAPMPLIVWSNIRMRRTLFPLAWLVQARTAELASFVSENLSGWLVVRSFAAEPHQVSGVARTAERLRWASEREIAVRARYQPLLLNVPRLGLIGVLLYGGHLAIEGDITIGALVAFNAYVTLLQAPFRMLGFIAMMAQRARAAAGRVFEILDAPVEIVDRPQATAITGPVSDVELAHVTFGYGAGPEVLTDFSLRIRAGETVALVGRSGCGKSSVARLLPRFYEVRSGSVRIGGRDVRDITLASLRAAVGLVPDEAFLFSASIFDNIAFGRPDATPDEVCTAAEAAGAAGFIAELPAGFDTVVGERGYTLSGGQRQRVALARTLLMNPPVLVLDDATSAVDVQTEEGIHAALHGLMDSRTTMVIAHRLSTIALADRVALMEGGRVVATGTHTELLDTVPAYAALLLRLEDDWQRAHAQPEPDVEDDDLDEPSPARAAAVGDLLAGLADLEPDGLR